MMDVRTQTSRRQYIEYESMDDSATDARNKFIDE